MNNEFSSIFKNLTDFKESALQKFDKNHTVDQGEKIFASLSHIMDEIGQKAKYLHRKFEENKRELSKKEVKDLGKKFQEMHKKFNEIYSMGEEKKKEITPRQIPHLLKFLTKKIIR